MKILVVRFSSIGDIVLTTPVVRVLAKAGYEVHFLTKKAYVQVLEGNPYIEQIHLLADDWSTMIQDLKRQHFNHVVDLHHNLRTARLKAQLGVSCSSFPKINWQKWLAVHASTSFLPDLHIVDRYFKAVQPLSLENDGFGLEFYFPDDFSFSTGEFLDSAGVKNDQYLAWVIGGAHQTKCYPEDKIAEVLSLIKSNIVLVGGPDEQEMGERLQNRFAKVVNSCGLLSIAESAMLIKDALKVLTNDTGMMHIAAAFKKQMVVFWGNTIPEFGMYPYLPDSKENYINLQIEGLRCRPCSKIGFEQCPKKHFRCMRDLSPKRVVEALNSLPL